MARRSDLLGSVSPLAGGASRAYDIVAALSPPKAPDGGAMVKAAPEGSESITMKALKFVPGLAAGGAGAFVWKSHRLLGFVAGHALASTALPIYHGGAERKRALCQLAVEGAAIGGSLLWKGHPFLGFVAGLLGGAVATSFVQGSPTNDLLKKWKSEHAEK